MPQIHVYCVIMVCVCCHFRYFTVSWWAAYWTAKWRWWWGYFVERYFWNEELIFNGGCRIMEILTCHIRKLTGVWKIAVFHLRGAPAIVHAASLFMKTTCLFSQPSSNFVWHFYNVEGEVREIIVKINTGEAEICKLLVPTMGQALKPLCPTPPDFWMIKNLTYNPSRCLAVQ